MNHDKLVEVLIKSSRSLFIYPACLPACLEEREGILLLLISNSIIHRYTLINFKPLACLESIVVSFSTYFPSVTRNIKFQNNCGGGGAAAVEMYHNKHNIPSLFLFVGMYVWPPLLACLL